MSTRQLSKTTRVRFYADSFDVPSHWLPNQTAAFLQEWQQQRQCSPRATAALTLDAVLERLIETHGDVRLVRYVAHRQGRGHAHAASHSAGFGTL